MSAASAAFGLLRSLAIYYGRPWRIGRMARFYGQFVGPGDVAFDIGAHVGSRSRALARTGARVVALEPQRLFHGFLKATAPRNIAVLKMAAGASAGTATFAVSSLHPTVSTLAPSTLTDLGEAAGFRTVVWDAQETVEVTTVDLLAARYGQPAFVKIDVEGAESEVLAGMSHPARTVAFEFLPGGSDAAVRCAARLMEIGQYEFNLVIGEGVGWHLTEWCDGESLRTVLDEPDMRSSFGDIYARLAGAGKREVA